MDTSKRFDWQEWLLVLGFVLSLVVAGFFVARSVRVASGLRQDEPIRPWMTIPYIAHAYDVPPARLYSALGVPPTAHDRRPLSRIAREQHRPVQDVIADVQRAIGQAPHSNPLPSAHPRGSPL